MLLAHANVNVDSPSVQANRRGCGIGMVRNDGSAAHGDIMLNEAGRRQAEYPMRVFMRIVSDHPSTLCCIA